MLILTHQNGNDILLNTDFVRCMYRCYQGIDPSTLNTKVELHDAQAISIDETLEQILELVNCRHDAILPTKVSTHAKIERDFIGKSCDIDTRP